MRLCIYSHHPDLHNGAVLSLLQLLKCRPEGTHCLIVFPTEGPAVAAFKEIGCDTAIIPHYWLCGAHITSPPGRFLSGIVRMKRRLAHWSTRVIGNYWFRSRHIQALKEWKPDVIYTNTSVIPMGFFVARALAVPHVVHLREFLSLDHDLVPDLGWRSIARLQQNAIIIANSKAVRDFWETKTHADIRHVVYNGLEPIKHAGIEPGKRRAAFSFLMAGRICRKKGQFMAVEALSLLPRGTPQPRLVLVGAGDHAGIIGLASGLGVGNLVTVEGPTSDVNQYYQMADAYLMCSQHEAFGRTTVEAMLHGLPVIGNAGRFCATSEIIEHEKTGLLYADEPAALATAMQRLIDNPAFAKQLGQNGRQQAERQYTVERYAQEIWQIIGQTAY